MNSELIPLMVVLPMACAVLLNVLHGRPRALRWLSLSAGLLFLALPSLVHYGSHYFGGYVRDESYGSLAVGIVYAFQAHARLLITALALVATLAIASYQGSTGRLSGAYLGFMMLGLGTCAAVLLTDDLFNLYVFLEITLISQTALVIATGTEAAWKAAVKYLIIANVAGNCLLLGIAMLLSIVGSLNITDMEAAIAAGGAALLHSPVFLAGCALIILAWSYASGLFPFHNIKAEMYATARPHAAGLMQTQTKFILLALGIIALRLFHGVPTLRYLALYISMGAMVFGVIMALRQDNYQSMLSYHAISQAGYVASGISIGTPIAVAAAVFHAVNNALYKTALFIGCECVQHRRKTTDFRSLGGLVQSIPFIAALILVAKLAISGVPPFNGFQSKLMLMVSAFDAGMPEVTAVMLLVSVLTFISMMKAYHMVFMRPAPAQEGPAEEVPKTYVLALIILVGLSVLFGFFPQIPLEYARQVAESAGVWGR
jgi:energy-converting hydrogenase B subunit F